MPSAVTEGKEVRGIEWFIGVPLRCVLAILNEIPNTEEKFDLGHVTHGGPGGHPGGGSRNKYTSAERWRVDTEQCHGLGKVNGVRSW